MARPTTGKRAASKRKSKATAATNRPAAKTKSAVRPRRSAPVKAKARPASAQSVGVTTQAFALVSRLVARAMSARLAPKGIGFGQFPVLLDVGEDDIPDVLLDQAAGIVTDLAELREFPLLPAQTAQVRP